jgi:dihydroxyacetone kinase
MAKEGSELQPLVKAPPWIQTMTGREAVRDGVKMLRDRQSSDTREGSASGWGQHAPKDVATKGGVQLEGVGRVQRSAVAYGTPRNVDMPSEMKPMTGPEVVMTTSVGVGEAGIRAAKTRMSRMFIFDSVHLEGFRST